MTRIAPIQKRGAVIGKLTDCHQRLVQFVADTRRHLAQSAELSGLNQIGLGLLKGGFGLFAFCNLAGQRHIGCRQRPRAPGHAAFKDGIGLGQGPAPFGRQKQQRPECQTDAGHRRGLQCRQPPGRGHIHQDLARHPDDRQLTRQVQRRLRQVRAPAHPPQLVRTGPENGKLGLAIPRGQPDLPRRAPPEQQVGPVRDKDQPGVIDKEHGLGTAAPGAFDIFDIGNNHQRPDYLPVGAKSGRGIGIDAVCAPRRHPGEIAVRTGLQTLMRAAKRAVHRPFERRMIANRPPDYVMGRGQNPPVCIGKQNINRRGLVRDLKQKRPGLAPLGQAVELPQGRMGRHQHGQFLIDLQLRTQTVGRKRQIGLGLFAQLCQGLPVPIGPDGHRQQDDRAEETNDKPKPLHVTGSCIRRALWQARAAPVWSAQITAGLDLRWRRVRPNPPLPVTARPRRSAVAWWST